MVEIYKLCGFLNLFDVIPDFVFPIFEHAGEFYFQHGKENTVEEFIKVKKEVLPRIINLRDGVVIPISIGSELIYAFQSDDTTLEYGEAAYLKAKLKGFTTDDAILKKQIQVFFEDVDDYVSEYLPAANWFGATGRRKKAVARVRLVAGNGNVVINKRDIDDYFGLETLKMTVRQPLVLTETYTFDVLANVYGGGLTGQAGAIRHGIARALCKADPNLRSPLKKAGLLTRDPRMKERKKCGLKAARRAPQFSKR